MITYKEAAEFLFDLLDEIDTADDAFKKDSESYRKFVQNVQARRFEVADTDGYAIRFKVKGYEPFPVEERNPIEPEEI